MVLLICTSHLYIPATLDIICKEKANGGSICIYTDRESIAEFFEKMYQDVPVFLLGRPRSHSLIDIYCKDVIDKKKRIKSFFKTKVVRRIYFFHEGFCEEANWLILYLRKNQSSEVCYMPIERTFDDNERWEEVFDIKHLLKKMLCYLTWGFHIHYYCYLNNIYPIMDKSFYRMCNSKEIPADYKEVIITSEIDNKLLAPNDYPYSSYLWLENSLRYMKVKWDENSYVKFINEFFNSAPKETVFFKGHPDEALKYDLESQLEEVPSFIPGNLLLKRFSCFIGAFSDLLFEAANAGTLTICTLYLFDIDSNDREMLVGYLKQRSEYIKYPTTLDELNAYMKYLVRI